MAKRYWPDESPLTKCLIIGTQRSPCIPVIGVVSDVHRLGVVESATYAQYYVSDTGSKPILLLRARRGDQARIAAAVTAEIKRIVPAVTLVRAQPLSANLESELRPFRLGATLFTAMGILALIVAAIGVYSVIAYTVSQRTNEMGIRVALGARAADITRLVIGEGIRTVAIGVIAGIIASIALGKLVASLLFGVSTRDPGVMIASALVLAIVGIVACAIPAIRAARVDAMTALRVD